VKQKAAALREHIEKTVSIRRAKCKALEQKRTEIASHAAEVVIVMDRAALSSFTKAQLEDQLAAHRLLDTILKQIPAKSNLKNTVFFHSNRHGG
jgi:hypothetical protein